MSAVCGGGGAADAWMNHTDAEVKKKKKSEARGSKVVHAAEIFVFHFL